MYPKRIKTRANYTKEYHNQMTRNKYSRKKFKRQLERKHVMFWVTRVRISTYFLD